MKENELSEACRMYGNDENCLQNIDKKLKRMDC
jgi:hypothetical protein